MNHVIIDTFITKVNPGFKVLPDILRMTRITNEELSQAPIYNEVGEELFRFCLGHTIIGYNVGFDQRFLTAADRRFGHQKYFDYLKYVRKHCKGLDSYKMVEVAKHFGIRVKNHHTALGDIEILRLIMNQVGWPGEEIEDD